MLIVWTREPSPFYVLALAVAVFGWFRLPGGPPRGPVMRWALLALLGTLATHAVFFGEDRYHIVITPMLCLLAAGAFRAHAEDTSTALHSLQSA
jgi:hypothetical protein